MNTTIEKLRALIKMQIRREELNFASLGGGGQTMNIGALEWVLKQLDALQEQPVCEGLEEEIKRYYEDMDGDCRYAQTARHFARWQREQMMKGAVETWMLEGSMFEPEFIQRKVIIIKEDKQ